VRGGQSSPALQGGNAERECRLRSLSKKMRKEIILHTKQISTTRRLPNFIEPTRKKNALGVYQKNRWALENAVAGASGGASVKSLDVIAKGKGGRG